MRSLVETHLKGVVSTAAAERSGGKTEGLEPLIETSLLTLVGFLSEEYLR